MPSTFNLSEHGRALVYAAVQAALLGGGSVVLFDGRQPRHTSLAVSGQHRLAEFHVRNRGTVHAAATGRVTWFRLFDAGGGPIGDGSVGTAPDDDLGCLCDERSTVRYAR